MEAVNTMKIEHRYLNIPIGAEAPFRKMKVAVDGAEVNEFTVQLAEDQVDYWVCLDMAGHGGRLLQISVEDPNPTQMNAVIQSPVIAGKEEPYRERTRPQFHFTPARGSIAAPIGLDCLEGQWRFYYRHNPFGKNTDPVRTSCAISKDLIHWQESEPVYALESRIIETPAFDGRHLYELQVDGDPGYAKWVLFAEDGTYEVGECQGADFLPDGPSRELPWHGLHRSGVAYARTSDGRLVQMGIMDSGESADMPFNRQTSVPVELGLTETADGIRIFAVPVKELQHLRVWKRSWSDRELMNRQMFAERLQFRIGPGEWPDIRILPAQGLPDDIGGELLEAILEIEIAEANAVEVRLCGITATLDFDEGTIACGAISAPLHPSDNGRVRLHLLLDKSSLEIVACGGRVILATGVQPPQGGNRELVVQCLRGRARVESAEVYGLRSIWPTREEAELIGAAADGDELLYESEHYKVYSGRVEDAVYGEPPAYVPDRNTIVSPTRAVEEFIWRRTPWGDMTRVVDRGNVWRPQAGIAQYPDLHTGYPTVDAACRLALDIFYRCGSDEFARPGERGLWSAGQFQGPGEGFGVWVRDTAHIALRMGNLLDPEGARRSLLFTTMGGFDNGVDGTAMPIVGIWDYYLASGDLTLVKETWHNLKERIAKLEVKFDADAGLVAADQSTSNDAFPEPECGGFSLSTEIYFMESFRAMARMGQLMGEPRELTGRWAEMGALLLKNIREKYWNDDAGFFTSGPQGSESFRRHYWESSGQETAMWPRFGIASREQRNLMLDRLPEVAMNEFGVNVFPYREETNHFCNAAWVAWTAGMAAAAGREGRLELLMKLIAQQVRNSVMNKTFFEAIDYHTGRAWRWPGQLWHATAFVSYFYFGVLGMEYDERGLTLAPAVPKQLADLRVENFRYRNARLDIRVKGWGTACTVKLDGSKVESVPAHLEGRHTIELTMENS